MKKHHLFNKRGLGTKSVPQYDRVSVPVSMSVCLTYSEMWVQLPDSKVSPLESGWTPFLLGSRIFRQVTYSVTCFFFSSRSSMEYNWTNYRRLVYIRSDMHSFSITVGFRLYKFHGLSTFKRSERDHDSMGKLVNPSPDSREIPSSNLVRITHCRSGDKT
jgi:hypothetical protein